MIIIQLKKANFMLAYFFGSKNLIVKSSDILSELVLVERANEKC